MESACVHLSELVDKKAKIIDIGTGNGLFLEVLHQVGFENLYAHEIAGEDLSRIKDITKDIYQDFDYNSIPSDFFDVVTLLDVVEHVIDPHYLLRTCERILKPGGIVYFHTPVVTKTDRLMHLMQKIPIASKVGCLWQAARTSIFHLQNYTQKSLQLLLKESGFKDIEIEIKNELSWPLSLYIRVYLLDKLGLPRFLVPVFYPALYPMLATNLFNANKSIVSARKALL
jgi:SAM-dependent methyltransferase